MHDLEDLCKPMPGEIPLSPEEVLHGCREGTIPFGPVARRVAAQATDPVRDLAGVFRLWGGYFDLKPRAQWPT